jgi:4-hydroxy-tetrahydrodipicolinate synthase
MSSQQPQQEHKLYHGVVVPMVTPFTSDGKLDEQATIRIVDHLLIAGVAGVFVLGTTGEDASMPPAMRSRLVRLTAERVAGRAIVYAGISHNCLVASTDAAREYRELGADVLVARLPTYYALDGSEQLAYFRTLLKRIPGPLMLYNISSTTHMTIPVEVVERLSEEPKVVGIKDSDADLDRLEQLVRGVGQRSDFSVLVGVTSLSAKALKLGADGIVPSPGNLVPDLCQQLYESAKNGEDRLAEDYQQRLNDVGSLIRGNRSLGQSLGRLKAAMSSRALCGPFVLPPLVTLDRTEQNAVERLFLNW